MPLGLNLLRGRGLEEVCCHFLRMKARFLGRPAEDVGHRVVSAVAVS